MLVKLEKFLTNFRFPIPCGIQFYWHLFVTSPVLYSCNADRYFEFKGLQNSLADTRVNQAVVFGELRLGVHIGAGQTPLSGPEAIEYLAELSLLKLP